MNYRWWHQKEWKNWMPHPMFHAIFKYKNVNVLKVPINIHSVLLEFWIQLIKNYTVCHQHSLVTCLTSTPARFCTGCLLKISNELQTKCNVNVNNLNNLEVFCLIEILEEIHVTEDNLKQTDYMDKNSIHTINLWTMKW